MRHTRKSENDPHIHHFLLFAFAAARRATRGLQFEFGRHFDFLHNRLVKLDGKFGPGNDHHFLASVLLKVKIAQEFALAVLVDTNGLAQHDFHRNLEVLDESLGDFDRELGKLFRFSRGAARRFFLFDDLFDLDRLFLELFWLLTAAFGAIEFTERHGFWFEFEFFLAVGFAVGVFFLLDSEKKTKFFLSMESTCVFLQKRMSCVHSWYSLEERETTTQTIVCKMNTLN